MLTLDELSSFLSFPGGHILLEDVLCWCPGVLLYPQTPDNITAAVSASSAIVVVMGSTLDKWHSLESKYNRISTIQDTQCHVLIILQCCGCGKITHWSISFGEHQNLVCALIEPQQVARASVSNLVIMWKWSNPAHTVTTVTSLHAICVVGPRTSELPPTV